MPGSKTNLGGDKSGSSGRVEGVLRGRTSGQRAADAWTGSFPATTLGDTGSPGHRPGRGRYEYLRAGPRPVRGALQAQGEKFVSGLGQLQRDGRMYLPVAQASGTSQNRQGEALGVRVILMCI